MNDLFPKMYSMLTPWKREEHIRVSVQAQVCEGVYRCGCVWVECQYCFSLLDSPSFTLCLPVIRPTTIITHPYVTVVWGHIASNFLTASISHLRMGSVILSTFSFCSPCIWVCVCFWSPSFDLNKTNSWKANKHMVSENTTSRARRRLPSDITVLNVTSAILFQVVHEFITLWNICRHYPWH